jgi:hypothetical protein
MARRLENHAPTKNHSKNTAPTVDFEQITFRAKFQPTRREFSSVQNQ